MIITKDMLNQKVSKDMFPTRLDSALNLYTYIKNKGLVLYNVNPITWNCLYPFFELNHKFTFDNYTFSNNDITFEELIEEYQNEYQKIYEKEKGYTKEKRKEILVSEYKNTFDLKNVTIGAELEPCYELKYSKSKNVWTLYYFENYVASGVDDIEKLIKQKVYDQEFIPLDSNLNKINGIDIVSNLPYILSNYSNVNILKENEIGE